MDPPIHTLLKELKQARLYRSYLDSDGLEVSSWFHGDVRTKYNFF